MPKKNIHSFNSGEVTDKLEGRSDHARYFNSCLRLENYLVDEIGPIDFRPGTEFIDSTKNNDPAILVPFIFSLDIAYQVEFGALYLRFVRDGAVIGAPAYEVSSPYSSSDIENIRFSQSSDLVNVMYVLDGVHKQRKLTRISDSSWTFEEVDFEGGPFLTVNLDEDKTITPSYPPWATGVVQKKNDVVTTVGSTISVPTYSSQNIDNAAAVLLGGGLVDIPVTGHGYTEGMGVQIAGTTNYDGNYIVQSGTTTNLVRILHSQDAETFAGTENIVRKSVPVDKGANLVGIPTNTNTFSSGSRVTLSGFASYNGSYEVHDTTTSSELVIVVDFVLDYFGSSEAINETFFHKSLTNHTTGPSNPTPPGNTTDWTDALTFTGSNLTLTANTAIFDSGHVGALFKISHPRNDNAITGKFSKIDSSRWIRVSKNTTWTATTGGIWSGIFEVQKSYNDGATIQTVKSFISVSGVGTEKNVTVSGEEIDDGAVYRVSLTQRDGGTMGFEFNIDEFRTDGIVKITEFVSSTQVVAEVKSVLGNVLTTDDWAEGAWSTFRGFPEKVQFHRRRLWYFSTRSLPTTYWYSNVDDFDKFTEGTDDDMAGHGKLDGDEINEIQWAKSSDSLICSTGAGLWRIGPDDGVATWTPSNITHRKQNSSGASPATPIEMGDSFLYISYNGIRVNELLYSEEIRKFSVKNLSLLVEHITEIHTLKQIVFVSNPRQYGFVLRSDGNLFVIGNNRNEQFTAWSRIITNGTVEWISVVPRGNEDELSLIVKRTIGGVTKRYKEILKPISLGYSDIKKSWFLDGALEFNLGSSISIESISTASPGLVTIVGHGLVSTDKIRISDSDMIEVNEVWGVSIVDLDSFNLINLETSKVLDTTDFTAITTSAGSLQKVANRFGNLMHLNCETVSALVDGTPYHDLVVSSGEIILPDGVYGNFGIIGLRYTGLVKPMTPDFEGGALSSNFKNISKAFIRFHRSFSATIGISEDEMYETVFEDEDEFLDSPKPLFSGIHPYSNDGRWSRDSNIIIKNTQPLPQSIVSISYELEGGGT